MCRIFYSPVVVFMVILFFVWLASKAISVLCLRPAKHSKNEGTAYACGEDNYNNTVQPDYSHFFPYAFFFTMAHVAALVMTTVPLENLRVFSIAFVYLAGAAIGLYILFRK